MYCEAPSSSRRISRPAEGPEIGIAATRAAGPVTITNAQCVAKSYPDFWEVYESLGGQIVRED